MHTVHTKRPFIKKGNMMMVMIVSIVVVLTMSALCAYSLLISRHEIESSKAGVEFSNIDASLDAVSEVVEISIKNKIIELIPDDLTAEEKEQWFKVDVLMSSHGEKIEQLVRQTIVMEYDSVKVEYKTRVAHYLYGTSTYYFDCVVVSIQGTDGKIYNLSFYIKDSDDNSGDGVYREKGTYISTWIS